MSRLILVSIFIACVLHGVRSSSCPCSDKTLCQTRPVKQTFGFYGFSTSQLPSYYEKFDWTKLTTLIVTGVTPDLPQLICYAKARNVRVTLLTDISVADLLSPQKTAAYISRSVAQVVTNNLDGLNMDFESSVAVNSSAYHAFTAAVGQLRAALLKVNKNYSLSLDYVNCADCVAGRTYDYMNLMKVIDYFILMDYDMQGTPSVMYERVGNTNLCKLLSNSPFPAIHKATERFLSLGVPPSKLVLAEPWYGYEDVCEVFYHSNRTCLTNCSNIGNGSLQRRYKDIMTTLREMSAEGRNWNSQTLTPMVTFIGTNSKYTQINYDDPWSLKIKYTYMIYRKLRGSGAWVIDAAGNGTSVQETADRELMWSVIPKVA